MSHLLLSGQAAQDGLRMLSTLHQCTPYPHNHSGVNVCVPRERNVQVVCNPGNGDEKSMLVLQAGQWALLLGGVGRGGINKPLT